jgi:hypothetical protein
MDHSMLETIWLHTYVEGIENHHVHEIMSCDCKLYDERDDHGFVEVWDLLTGDKLVMSPHTFFDGYRQLTNVEAAIGLMLSAGRVRVDTQERH